jgi:hypothetical protein
MRDGHSDQHVEVSRGAVLDFVSTVGLTEAVDMAPSSWLQQYLLVGINPRGNHRDIDDILIKDTRASATGQAKEN